MSEVMVTAMSAVKLLKYQWTGQNLEELLKFNRTLNAIGKLLHMINFFHEKLPESIFNSLNLVNFNDF